MSPIVLFALGHTVGLERMYLGEHQCGAPTAVTIKGERVCLKPESHKVE